MYKTIKITFNNGNSVKYNENEWNDWALFNGFVVIKNNDGAWIAIYNANSIFAVELLKD